MYYTEYPESIMPKLEPHWLRPEETAKVVEIIDDTLTQGIQNLFQSANQQFSEAGGRKLSEDEVSQFSELAKGCIPTNATGKELDPQVLQSLSLVVGMMKKASEMDEELGKDFLPGVQEKALEAMKNDKSDGLGLVLKMVMKVFDKKEEDSEEFEEEHGKDFTQKFTDSLFKLLNNPDDFTKDDKCDFEKMFKSFLGMVTENSEDKQKEKPDQDEEEEAASQNEKGPGKKGEIWEGGSLLEIVEGFAMSDRKTSLDDLFAGEEMTPEELALGGSAVTNISKSIEDAGAIFPSMADKLMKGPSIPGVS
jgi:hypothetical protein